MAKSEDKANEGGVDVAALQAENERLTRELNATNERLATATASMGDALKAHGVDPALRPVRVKNNGKKPWLGSDYADVGDGRIYPGEVDVVTFKKSQELLAGDYVGADAGVGPFEIVEA